MPLSEFQQFAVARFESDYPQWKKYRELVGEGDPQGLQVCYAIPSEAKASNILWVVYHHDEIITKFAANDSHEHYDTFHWQEYDDPFLETYSAAMDEFVTPVIEGRLVVVWVKEGRGTLTANPEEFVADNGIEDYTIEAWGDPSTYK